MITANLCGNFGNHLASLTICRVVGEKLGYEWGVNPIPSHDYYNGANQLYFMDVDFGKQPVDGIVHAYHETWVDYKGANLCRYEPKIFEINDNTILLGHKGAKGGVWQSEDYFIDRKEDIKKWYKINSKYELQYQNKLLELGINLDDNTCVINFRGGEYQTIPRVLLKHEYWAMSINHMLSINPNMKFIVITDDVTCAINYMPFKTLVIHIDIGFDYYVINKAKWLILSNSSFGLWAGWLNDNVNKIIAPKYWSQWNNSDGYWGIGDQYYRCFTYMDREGKIFDYETCKLEAITYYKDRNLI